MTTGISGNCLKARGVRSSGLFFTTIKPNQNMKNILIGFLSATVLLLTIGQASKDDSYEVITYFSSDSNDYHSNWGKDVQLWQNSGTWKAANYSWTGETSLKSMYKDGWRVVSLQKTNDKLNQFVWVFERKK